jgi:hypothetical protein
MRGRGGNGDEGPVRAGGDFRAWLSGGLRATCGDSLRCGFWRPATRHLMELPLPRIVALNAAAHAERGSRPRSGVR